ncbi:hypothetical protein HY573_00355 [Candidatus Parcubacteria bacterium]|nr:hypothetical protein [Candidatus Parcubacteria bacterium]
MLAAGAGVRLPWVEMLLQMPVIQPVVTVVLVQHPVLAVRALHTLAVVEAMEMAVAAAAHRVLEELVVEEPEQSPLMLGLRAPRILAAEAAEAARIVLVAAQAARGW